MSQVETEHQKKLAETDFENLWRQIRTEEPLSIKESHRKAYLAGRAAERFERQDTPERTEQ